MPQTLSPTAMLPGPFVYHHSPGMGGGIYSHMDARAEAGDYATGLPPTHHLGSGGDSLRAGIRPSGGPMHPTPFGARPESSLRVVKPRHRLELTSPTRVTGLSLAALQASAPTTLRPDATPLPKTEPVFPQPQADPLAGLDTAGARGNPPVSAVSLDPAKPSTIPLSFRHLWRTVNRAFPPSLVVSRTAAGGGRRDASPDDEDDDVPLSKQEATCGRLAILSSGHLDPMKRALGDILQHYRVDSASRHPLNQSFSCIASNLPLGTARSRVETQSHIKMVMIDQLDTCPWTHIAIPQELIQLDRNVRPVKKSPNLDPSKVLSVEILVACASDFSKGPVSMCNDCVSREHRRMVKRLDSRIKRLQQQAGGSFDKLVALPGFAHLRGQQLEPLLRDMSGPVTADALRALPGASASTSETPVARPASVEVFINSLESYRQALVNLDEATHQGPQSDDHLRIIVFNSSQHIPLTDGMAKFRVRITCYSRHHQELTGYCLVFIFRDHQGRFVTATVAPPIMVTDDHKSAKVNRRAGGAGAGSGRDRAGSSAPPSPDRLLPAAGTLSVAPSAGRHELEATGGSPSSPSSPIVSDPSLPDDVTPAGSGASSPQLSDHFPMAGSSRLASASHSLEPLPQVTGSHHHPHHHPHPHPHHHHHHQQQQPQAHVLTHLQAQHGVALGPAAAEQGGSLAGGFHHSHHGPSHHHHAGDLDAGSPPMRGAFLSEHGDSHLMDPHLGHMPPGPPESHHLHHHLHQHPHHSGHAHHRVSGSQPGLDVGGHDGADFAPVSGSGLLRRPTTHSPHSPDTTTRGIYGLMSADQASAPRRFAGDAPHHVVHPGGPADHHAQHSHHHHHHHHRHSQPQPQPQPQPQSQPQHQQRQQRSLPPQQSQGHFASQGQSHFQSHPQGDMLVPASATGGFPATSHDGGAPLHGAPGGFEQRHPLDSGVSGAAYPSMHHGGVPPGTSRSEIAPVGGPGFPTSLSADRRGPGFLSGPDSTHYLTPNATPGPSEPAFGAYPPAGGHGAAPSGPGPDVFTDMHHHSPSSSSPGDANRLRQPDSFRPPHLYPQQHHFSPHPPTGQPQSQPQSQPRSQPQPQPQQQQQQRQQQQQQQQQPPPPPSSAHHHPLQQSAYGGPAGTMGSYLQAGRSDALMSVAPAHDHPEEHHPAELGPTATTDPSHPANCYFTYPGQGTSASCLPGAPGAQAAGHYSDFLPGPPGSAGAPPGTFPAFSPSMPGTIPSPNTPALSSSVLGEEAPADVVMVEPARAPIGSIITGPMTGSPLSEVASSSPHSGQSFYSDAVPFIGSASGLLITSTVAPVSPPNGKDLPWPEVSRVIPREGSIRGGVEVTVLGRNFIDGVTINFGCSQAMVLQVWSDTTLICLLPPAAEPGDVPVDVTLTQAALEGLQRTALSAPGAETSPSPSIPASTAPGDPPADSPPGPGPSNVPDANAREIVLFSYRDDMDKALMELALRVIGVKVNEKPENSSQVSAMMSTLSNFLKSGFPFLNTGGGAGPSDASEPIEEIPDEQVAEQAHKHVAESTDASADSDAASDAGIGDGSSATSTPPPRAGRPLRRSNSFSSIHSGSCASGTTDSGPGALERSRSFDTSLLDLDLVDLHGGVLSDDSSAPQTPRTEGQSNPSEASPPSRLPPGMEIGGGQDEETILRALSAAYGFRTFGLPFEHRSTSGHTLLHMAAISNYFRLCWFILERAFSSEVLHAVDFYGRTPLHLAIIHDHPVVATLLLFAGADAFATDAYGRTCLQYAAVGSRCRSILARMLARSDSPLHAARLGTSPRSATFARLRSEIHALPELFGSVPALPAEARVGGPVTATTVAAHGLAADANVRRPIGAASGAGPTSPEAFLQEMKSFIDTVADRVSSVFQPIGASSLSLWDDYSSLVSVHAVDLWQLALGKLSSIPSSVVTSWSENLAYYLRQQQQQQQAQATGGVSAESDTSPANPAAGTPASAEGAAAGAPATSTPPGSTKRPISPARLMNFLYALALSPSSNPAAALQAARQAAAIDSAATPVASATATTTATTTATAAGAAGAAAAAAAPATKSLHTPQQQQQFVRQTVTIEMRPGRKRDRMLFNFWVPMLISFFGIMFLLKLVPFLYHSYHSAMVGRTAAVSVADKLAAVPASTAAAVEQAATSVVEKTSEHAGITSFVSDTVSRLMDLFHSQAPIIAT
ncbi:hypothetical protein H696_03691 [Fonticula alba]|uniref:IPT/TIG domain-containing protein n=1 Tax=Fonticula alba TaxID=691883 RepID=A0A058Z4P7_FONAL|nr:hypothetical protein H696_03691 [Fonticula alba]KCV69264.1 hypothetical protein H696_03691 [Fonticula alba]|eukprot:XP_009495829.1 hypothetical protein H696_03691 [Fonticula alba]